MNTIQTRCKECGTNQTVVVPDELSLDMRQMFVKAINNGVLCEECDGKAQERKREAERKHAARIAFDESGIPEEAAEWDESKADDRQREFSKDVFRQGVQLRKSLWVSGPNRVGKTRAVCRSAATMLKRGNLGRGEARYFSARDLRRKITRLSQGDSEYHENSFYASLAKTTLLIIDDIDKANWTFASLEGLFRIIDDRAVRPFLRTWITTNCSGSELVELMIGRDEQRRETAISIVARLREMCHEVSA